MRTILFLILAFGFSWGLWFLAAPHVAGAGRTLLAAIYMFGPLIGALLTGALLDRGRVAAKMGVTWRINGWWLIAWVAAPALVFASFYASLLFPGITTQAPLEGAKAAIESAGQTFPPDLAERMPPLPALVLIAMVGGIFPNAIAAFGEEAGWRGYLWTDLRPLGFWPASLIVGVAWGLWHAPIIISGHNYGLGYEGYPWKGVLFMTAFCTALSPVMGLLRERSGSVIPAAIFHGTMNGIAGVSLIMLTGGDVFTRGIVGAPGLIVLGAVSLLLLFAGVGRAAR